MHGDQAMTVEVKYGYQPKQDLAKKDMYYRIP